MNGYRLNLFLLLILALCAFGIVTSQHRARRLHHEIEKQNVTINQLNTEYGRLQIERSTQGVHARIAHIAKTNLNMVMPTPQHTVVLQVNAGEKRP